MLNFCCSTGFRVDPINAKKVLKRKFFKTKNPNISIRVLWYLQGSNQGHMDFQSIALPSELRYRAIAGAKIG